MFRPVRTILLMMFTFVAGVFYERATYKETCANRGGEISEGLCLGVEE